jgi:hypothetical protein
MHCEHVEPHLGEKIGVNEPVPELGRLWVAFTNLQVVQNRPDVARGAHPHRVTHCTCSLANTFYLVDGIVNNPAYPSNIPAVYFSFTLCTAWLAASATPSFDVRVSLIPHPSPMTTQRPTS